MLAKDKLLRAVETITLFIALAMTIPVLPSNEDPIELFPAAAFACVSFGISRFIRHLSVRNSFFGSVTLLLEILGFSLFVFISNRVANILLGL